MDFLPPDRSYPSGFGLHRRHFDDQAQAELIKTVQKAVTLAPWFQPTMPRTGQPLSVRMSNFGPLGWVADRKGYRYQPHHPETGAPWPPIPDLLLRAWHALTGCAVPPDCCLINWYQGTAKMGLHVDKDEADYAFPVVSVSLGDDAVFVLGQTVRKGPYRRMMVKSGDVCVLAGAARLRYHGVDRIVPGSNLIIPGGGRWNLTLRRARPAP